MLDVDSALSYLFEHGLADPEWIVGGDLILRSAARRNRNLRIEGPSGAGYLIKEPDKLARTGRDTLNNEADFHEFCQQELAAAPVSRFLPQLVLRDRDRALHALKLIPDASTFAPYHLRRPPEDFPLAPSHGLGDALGTLHRVFRRPGLVTDSRLNWLSQSIPWIFGAAQRPSPPMLADLSPAGARVFQIIQSDAALGAALDGLSRVWCPETLIHGDIKFDNILVSSSSGRQEVLGAAVWIVDWEFVQIGDPAWDVGSALHDYLVFWTSSMPLEPQLSAEAMIDRAHYPLSSMRPAMRALWDGYREAAGMAKPGSGREANLLLRRAVQYSAARLVMSAHELSLEQEELSTQAVLLLQIGANILADPDSGQLLLYGLPQELGP
jgi:hypothetical protein